MSVLEEIRAGELFAARDGNGSTYDDVRFPGEGDPEDFVLDSSGEEVRRDDWVLILDGHDWAGRVCKVESVSRAQFYAGRAALRRRTAAWSPSSALNTVRLVDGTHHWAARPDRVRRVNLTAEDGQRLMLGELLAKRSQLDLASAGIQHDRVVVSVEINRLRELLGERID